MSTAIEDAMRFRPSDRGGKVFYDTKEAKSALGYRVRMVRPQARYGRGKRGGFVRFDVFGPCGWIGVEPDIYWAMKRADSHYFDARRRIA